MLNVRRAKWSVLAAVGATLAGLIAMSVCVFVSSSKSHVGASLRDTMVGVQEVAARQLNDQLPKNFDKTTTLTSASAAGSALIFHYRLAVSSVDIDKTQFRSKTFSWLTQNVCRISGMRDTMRDGGKYVYQYRDQNNSLIDSIEITNDSCLPPASLPPHHRLAAFFGSDLPTMTSR
jgi:hypothetical protein